MGRREEGVKVHDVLTYPTVTVTALRTDPPYTVLIST